MATVEILRQLLRAGEVRWHDSIEAATSSDIVLSRTVVTSWKVRVSEIDPARAGFPRSTLNIDCRRSNPTSLEPRTYTWAYTTKHHLSIILSRQYTF
jgi:hypothetical protein